MGRGPRVALKNRLQNGEDEDVASDNAENFVLRALVLWAVGSLGLVREEVADTY